jgi:hypothetical protein
LKKIVVFHWSAQFYYSAELNLNVTRRPRAGNRHRPSGGLFEGAACGNVTLTNPRIGERYFDVGTMDGYMEAMLSLQPRSEAAAR